MPNRIDENDRSLKVKTAIEKFNHFIEKTDWNQRDLLWSFDLLSLLEKEMNNAFRRSDSQSAFELLEYIYRLNESGKLLPEKYDYKIPEICDDLIRRVIEELGNEDLEWFDQKMVKLLDDGVITVNQIVYTPELLEMCTEGKLGDEIERQLKSAWLKNSSHLPENAPEPEDWDCVESLLNLVHFYLYRGQWEEAEKLIESHLHWYNFFDAILYDAIEERNFDRVDELVTYGLKTFDGENKAYLFAKRYRSLRKHRRGNFSGELFEAVDPHYVFSEKDLPLLEKQLGSDELLYVQMLAKKVLGKRHE